MPLRGRIDQLKLGRQQTRKQAIGNCLGGGGGGSVSDSSGEQLANGQMLTHGANGRCNGQARCNANKE